MTAILTPALALRHLLQLSTDVRAAIVLASDDLAVLACEPGEGARPAAARPAAARPAAAPPAAAPPTAVPPPRADAPPPAGAGTVLAISDEEHVLAVLAGAHALLPLLRHDLATLLADMRAGEGKTGASSSVQVLERADSAVSAAIFAGLGIPAAGKS